MKLKLIQSGGFTGRSKFAEEDLSSYPELLQDYLDEYFSAFQPTGGAAGEGAVRDNFLYFIEYKGFRIPFDDQAKPAPELAEILLQLKSKLQY